MKTRKNVQIELDEKTEKKIYEIIENDIYIVNFKHFTEICIHEYIKNYKNKKKED